MPVAGSVEAGMVPFVRAHEALHAAAVIEQQEREDEEVDIPDISAISACVAHEDRGLGGKSGWGEQHARRVEQEQQRGQESSPAIVSEGEVKTRLQCFVAGCGLLLGLCRLDASAQSI